MRRKTRTIALAAVAALALTAVTGAGACGQATLRFFDMSPTVKVRGAHFIAGESVRVTLRAGTAKRVRLTRTSATGGFTVDFGSLREKDRCGVSMTLVALGGQGDRASYRLPPRECPTAATDKATN